MLNKIKIYYREIYLSLLLCKILSWWSLCLWNDFRHALWASLSVRTKTHDPESIDARFID